MAFRVLVKHIQALVFFGSIAFGYLSFMPILASVFPSAQDLRVDAERNGRGARGAAGTVDPHPLRREAASESSGFVGIFGFPVRRRCQCLIFWKSWQEVSNRVGKRK